MSAFGNVSGEDRYPSVSFKSVGDSVAGRIVGLEDYQEKEFADDSKRGVRKGDPKVYEKSGDPVMGVRITLEMTPGDDTSRVTLWAQGARLMKAVAKAFRAEGRDDITTGDDLAVTFNGYDGRAKTFVAAYARADVAADQAA